MSLARTSLLVALVVLAGCTGIELGGYGCNSDGLLFASVVDEPPANATVINSTNDQIVDQPIIQETLEEAAMSGNVTKDLKPREYCQVRDALAELPEHDGQEFGYYIQYQGDLIRLQLAVET